MNKDYVKQLESANDELQRKLEEQGEELSKMTDRFVYTRSQLKNNNLVVICSDESDAIHSGIGRERLGSLAFRANLIVVPASQEEKQKVFEAYQISPHVKLDLFKSIKDRNNKQGSIYDEDLLEKYAKGESVKPYVI